MTAMDPILGQSNLEQNSDWFTVLASELQSTATRTSGDFYNPGVQGIILSVTVANEAGTCTFQPKLATVDDAGNVLVLVAFTAIAANGNTLYWIHPHADKTATIKNSFTEMGTSPVPRRWRIILTYAGTPASDKMDTEVHACYVR